jgi:hypothetical protein
MEQIMLDYHYITPRGNEINSAVEMTPAELQEWDEMMEGYEAWLDTCGIESEEDYLAWQEEQAEDRDSDGYAWERKTLDKVAMSY